MPAHKGWMSAALSACLQTHSFLDSQDSTILVLPFPDLILLHFKESRLQPQPHGRSLGDTTRVILLDLEETCFG
jgi:hypothetical protein